MTTNRLKLTFYAIALTTLASLVSSTLYGAASTSTSDELHVLKEYKSLYRNITVVQKNNWRCVRLKNKKNPYNSQSCLKVDAPQELLFFYSQAMMAVMSTQPDGLNVLSVGLGGGTIATALHSYFKNIKVTTVEIDPKMLDAARDYMNFNEIANNQVEIQDARYFIRKEGKRKALYDVVLLDAFNGEYIPEHLTTKEFLEEVKAVLKPGGMVLSNTFSYKDFYHSESVTYDAVFADFCSMRSAGARTIIAFKGKACDASVLRAAIAKNTAKLDPFIPNSFTLVDTITDTKEWDHKARIFTDQFSPANLYNAH